MKFSSEGVLGHCCDTSLFLLQKNINEFLVCEGEGVTSHDTCFVQDVLYVDLNWLKIISESVSIPERRKLVSVYVLVVVRMYGQCLQPRPWLHYYIIITIVRSHTGKYHEFVAVCIVTSAQHE